MQLTILTAAPGYTMTMTGQPFRSKPPVPRTGMRAYVAPPGLAACGIGAGCVLARSTFDLLHPDFEKQREKWKEQEAGGTLLDHWNNDDLDSLQWSDVEMKVSSIKQTRLGRPPCL